MRTNGWGNVTVGLGFCKGGGVFGFVIGVNGFIGDAARFCWVWC